MKQIELKLKKRLLIIEKIITANGEEIDISESMIFGIEKMVKAKFICKGSEVTEDLVKGFIEYDNEFELFQYYLDTVPIMGDTALNAFKSAIMNNGYYWGENPFEYPKQPLFINANLNGFSENDVVDFKYEQHQFNEAELKTFNPEKTLIFEIL